MFREHSVGGCEKSGPLLLPYSLESSFSIMFSTYSLYLTTIVAIYIYNVFRYICRYKRYNIILYCHLKCFINVNFLQYCIKWATGTSGKKLGLLTGISSSHSGAIVEAIDNIILYIIIHLI